MWWIKFLIFAALAVALWHLAAGLRRDDRDGKISTHLGTFNREDSPVEFWFWRTNYGVIIVLAAIAAIAELVWG